MNFSKQSLMIKLMFGINIATIVMLTIFGFEIYTSNVETSLSIIKNEITNVSNSIAISTIEFYIHPDEKEFNFVANKIRENKIIESVVFRDNNGKILAQSKSSRNDSSLGILKKDIIDEENAKLGTMEILYNHDELDLIKSKTVKTILLYTFITLLALSTLVYFILKKITNKLFINASEIKINTQKTKLSANEAKKVSEELSSATTEQASSIQETVSTLEEINSQVKNNLESIKSSSLKADESYEIASKGKVIVCKMIESMGEIQSANHEIMSEISKGNQRISGIVKIINEISQKTTIINDIVFKTRLLSFNASVEAARAGEHGKGFAVVADEIGSLAQVSGEASKEITMILDASIKKVNEVVIETNENVKKLIEAGNEKISDGALTADECRKVFDDVVNISIIVKEMMNQITIASKEQVDGIGNISVAMNQLDQTTHINNKSAISSFENSKALSLQAEELMKSVNGLETLIFGQNVQEYISNDSKPKKIETLANGKKAIKQEKNIPQNINQTNEVKISKIEIKKHVINQIQKAEPELKVEKKIEHNAKTKKPIAELAIKKDTIIPSHDDSRFEDV